MASLEERFCHSKNMERFPEPDEKKIMQTVSRSRKALEQGLEMESVSYFEFLFQQVKYIEKRWWLLQLLVLAGLWAEMYSARGHIYLQRSSGILVPVFVILIVPELWKNLRTQSVEIESAAYFNLRQIYAARLTLFAMVDFLLLCVFFAAAFLTLPMTLADLVTQVVIPFNVTCCICCRTLCGRRCSSEGLAIGLSLAWSAVWFWVVMSDQVYQAISGAAWIVLLLLSAGYLFYAVRRVLRDSRTQKEVNPSWI